MGLIFEGSNTIDKETDKKLLPLQQAIEGLKAKTEKQAKTIAELIQQLQKETYEPLQVIETLAVKIPNLPEDDLTPISDFILKKMGYKNPNGKSWTIPIKPEFFRQINGAVFEACNKDQTLSDTTYTIVEQLLKSNNTTLLDDILTSLPNKKIVVQKLNELLTEIGNKQDTLHENDFTQKVQPLLQLIIQGVESKNA